MVEKLRELFRIEIPLELKRTGGSQTILYPEGDRAVIEYMEEDELVEAFATLRLGLDYSPLLATLWFQKDLSEEEERYADMFHVLITPIWFAWTWINAQRYLPEELLEKELKEMYEFSQFVLMSSKDIPESLRRKSTIGLYLTFKGLGYPAKLRLEGETKEWREYMKAMEDMLFEKPSPHLLTKLPGITKAPYRVEVKEEPYLHYEVKKVV